MMRYEVLDGFRGYFLAFMVVNHLVFRGGSLIARFNLAELGYVQDAQGFVFLSGLIAGLHYTRGYLKGDYEAMDRKVLGRAGVLMCYHLALVTLLFGLADLFPGVGAHWGAYFAEFLKDPVTTSVGAAALLYQPSLLDILPQYVLYLAVSPLVIRLVLNGRGLHVLVGSAIVWFAVQLGMHLPLVAGAEWLGRNIGPNFVTRTAFNPLAWQILFLGGLLLGCAVAMGTFRTEEWFNPRRPGPLLVAVGFVVVFMIYRLGFTFGLVPEALARRFGVYDDRSELSLVYLLNFVALGYAVAWLLVCGQRAQSLVARTAHRALHRVFQLRFLRFIGQHSLQVYAYHVLVIYLVVVLDQSRGPFSESTKAMITLAGIASLALPAWLHTQRRRLYDYLPLPRRSYGPA